MKNPLMNSEAVASFIGGISPRTAAGLMRTMPCVNVSNGEQRKRLRVYQSDLEQWLAKRRAVQPVHSSAKAEKPAAQKPRRGDGLDENGYVLKRHA